VQTGLTDCKDIAVSIGVLEYWSDALCALISPILLLRGVELWDKGLALEQADQAFTTIGIVRIL
jgi:hypothetical protein